MTQPRPRSRAFTVAIIAVVCGGLFLWITRGRTRGGGAPAATESTAAPSSAAPEVARPGGPSGGSETPPPAEQLPLPDCWEGLARFDQAVTLDGLRIAIAQAAARNDPTLLGYLQERLAELVGDNPNLALEVIGWAEKGTAPLVDAYLDALKTTGAIQNPKVVDRLLALGEGGKTSPELRRAALNALETQKHLGADAMRRLKAVALDREADELAWVATRTLGRAMTEEYQRTGKFENYWKELLDIGQRSPEAAVRTLALEMPSYGDPILDGKSIDPLARMLKTDPDPHVREMAAHRLGVTREPDRALEVFRDAFGSESNLCVRWAIFRFAVRAAGARALPLLQEFARIEPRLLLDYQDFKRLYDSGIVDFARIWEGKEERIQCVGDE